LLYLVRFDFVQYYYLGKLIEKLDILSQRSDYGNGSCNNENMILFKLEYLMICALKELIFEREECDLLTDIYQINKTDQQEE